MEYIYWPSTVLEYYKNAVYRLGCSDTQVYNYKIFCSNTYSLLEQYLRKGRNDSIVIKTSVTGKRKSNHEIDTKLLENILLSARAICPHSKIILADGPAYTNSYFKECRRLGWDIVASKYNISILDFNYDNGYYIGDCWPIAKSWLQADKIINICKAKTHKRFGVTLSLKNMLGIFLGEKLGYPKFSHKHEYVPKLLYEVYSLSPRILNIIDGYHGIEGEGPMHGHPTKSDFIVLGTDSYSCDFQATIEMGFAPVVTLANIHPFNCELKYNFDLDYRKILDLRHSYVDFYPNISCAWMFDSLNNSFDALQKNYEVLLGGIRKCWSKKI